MYKIRISSDFSATPGARHRDEGPYPGMNLEMIYLYPSMKKQLK